MENCNSWMLGNFSIGELGNSRLQIREDPNLKRIDSEIWKFYSFWMFKDFIRRFANFRILATKRQKFQNVKVSKISKDR